MPSSVIRYFQYDPLSQVLTIEFVSGARYLYEQVPPDVVEAFRQYREKGFFYNQQIKGKYLFIRIKGVGDQLAFDF